MPPVFVPQNPPGVHAILAVQSSISISTRKKREKLKEKLLTSYLSRSFVESWDAVLFVFRDELCSCCVRPASRDPFLPFQAVPIAPSPMISMTSEISEYTIFSHNATNNTPTTCLSLYSPETKSEAVEVQSCCLLGRLRTSKAMLWVLLCFFYHAKTSSSKQLQEAPYAFLCILMHSYAFFCILLHSYAFLVLILAVSLAL